MSRQFLNEYRTSGGLYWPINQYFEAPVTFNNTGDCGWQYIYTTIPVTNNWNLSITLEPTYWLLLLNVPVEGEPGSRAVLQFAKTTGSTPQGDYYSLPYLTTALPGVVTLS
jgi:hypothetical protein